MGVRTRRTHAGEIIQCWQPPAQTESVAFSYLLCATILRIASAGLARSTAPGAVAAAVGDGGAHNGADGGCRGLLDRQRSVKVNERCVNRYREAAPAAAAA